MMTIACLMVGRTPDVRVDEGVGNKEFELNYLMSGSSGVGQAKV